MAEEYAINWVCPYCRHGQVLTEINHRIHWENLNNERSRYQRIGCYVDTKVCVNPECRELTLGFKLIAIRYLNGAARPGDPILEFNLMPESSAKPQPDYIPAPIVENYKQACRIRDLSPNASATMARRCLQGMIRNFCEIERPNLFQEIEALKKLVDEGKAPQGVAADVVDHIHAVREKGNIGAHMKGDVNLMVDVEREEAQILIDLIEMLFDEWYVARFKRQERLAAAKSLMQAPPTVG